MGNAGLSPPNEENIVSKPTMCDSPSTERSLRVEYLIFLPVTGVNVSQTYNSICWRGAWLLELDHITSDVPSEVDINHLNAD